MADRSFLEEESVDVLLPTRCRYLIRGDLDSTNEVILMLHGYGESAKSMLDRLSPDTVGSSPCISLSAPYPLVKMSELGPLLGNVWYFYDSKSDIFLTTLNQAAEFVLGALKALNLSDKKVTLVGYSQGGFVSSEVATLFPNVQRLVLLSCGLRSDVSRWPRDVQVDYFLGDQDEYFPLERGEGDFAKIKAHHPQAKFHLMPAQGHALNGAYRARIKAELGLE